KVRVLVLDPRVAGAPDGKEQFELLARQFGRDPLVLLEECRYSTATLLALQEQLGERLEVRFYRQPARGAQDHFFLPGRSYHKYNSDAPSRRLDVIVPYVPDGPEATAWGEGMLRVKDRPDHEQVKRYTEAFGQLWDQAASIEELKMAFRAAA